MKILIIIPAYNEAQNILQVVRGLKQAMPDADYVVIDDCSIDETLRICESNCINVIHLPVNLGIGGGVQTGYLYALNNGYDIAIQMDGDGQHDPRYIPALIKPIVEGKSSITIGSRFIEKNGFQSTGFRRAGIKFLSALIRLCSGKKIYDVTSGFRAIDKKLIALYANNYAQDYPEPEAIIAAALSGAPITEIPVIMQERGGGTSSITPLRSLYYMLKVSLAIALYRITYSYER